MKDITNETVPPQNAGMPGQIVENTNERLSAWKGLRYGMFIHWGLYAVFGGAVNGKPVEKGYSEQIQMWANIPEAEYIHAAKAFSGDKFDPEAICKLAKDAGMNYIVITSKHHDGFCMFDTKTTDYNVVKQTPYGKDPLKLLSDECKKQGLGFGVYYSLVDWHQGHEYDEDNNNAIPAYMESVIEQQLRELMTNYGPIAEVWFDMGNPTAEQSEKFKKIVTDFQPYAAVNSRIWNNLGDFRTLGDNQIPAYTLDNPWQTPASIYHETWGYRSWQVRDDLFGKVKNLVKGITSVRARGGNYLLNIGPLGDGSIVPFEKAVLQEIGNWLNRHKEAVLDASATYFGGQSWGEVTVRQNHLFLHVTHFPTSGKIVLPGLVNRVESVCEDGRDASLDWTHQDGQLEIICPKETDEEVQMVIKVILAGELRMIPAHTTVLNGQKPLIIDQEQFYAGYGFSDEGYYTSLQQTVIRRTVYIASATDEKVMIALQGHIFDATEKYAVTMNDEKQICTGRQLMQKELGPFTVKADEINMLKITLAEPAYKEKDLNLSLDAMVITASRK